MQTPAWGQFSLLMVAAGSLPWPEKDFHLTPPSTRLWYPNLSSCVRAQKNAAPETHTWRFWSQLSAVRPEHLFAIGVPGPRIRCWLILRAQRRGSENHFRRPPKSCLCDVLSFIQAGSLTCSSLRLSPLLLSLKHTAWGRRSAANDQHELETSSGLFSNHCQGAPLMSSRCQKHLGGFSRSPPSERHWVLSVAFLKLYCGHRSARNPAHVQVLIQPFFSKAHSFASNKLQNDHKGR